MELDLGLPDGQTAQVVQIGNVTSSTLTLSPLLYTLFTHDCIATHSSNAIVTLANDTKIAF